VLCPTPVNRACSWPSSQHLCSAPAVAPGLQAGPGGIAPCPSGLRANPQLGSLLSPQPAHSSLCAGFAAQAAGPRGLANWCEQCYLFSDLREWRPDGSEKPVPPSLLPSQACGEVLTGLVSCHLWLGYPATACTTKTSARLMTLGSWPPWSEVLLNVCSLSGVPPLLEREPSVNSPAPHGDVGLPGCSAKTLKMQLFQSTANGPWRFIRNAFVPRLSLLSCAMPSPAALSCHREMGSGPPFFKALGHHSALHRSGAHSVPERVLGPYQRLTTTIAQNLASCGSLPLPVPGSTSSRRGCTACSPPTSAVSAATLQILTQQRMPCPSCPPALPPQAPKGAVTTPNLRTQGPGREQTCCRSNPAQAAAVLCDFSHWPLKWETTADPHMPKRGNHFCFGVYPSIKHRVSLSCSVTSSW